MREKAGGGVCGGQAEVRPTAAALQASARAAESVVKKGGRKKIIKKFGLAEQKAAVYRFACSYRPLRSSTAQPLQLCGRNCVRLVTFPPPPRSQEKEREKSLNVLIRADSKRGRPIFYFFIFFGGVPHITRGSPLPASAGGALLFIFTSYSSMKGSFVVYWLIDFNEKHSIVANAGVFPPPFSFPFFPERTELRVPLELGIASKGGDAGRGTRDPPPPLNHPTRPSGVGGGTKYDMRAYILAYKSLIPYPLHCKLHYRP